MSGDRPRMVYLERDLIVVILTGFAAMALAVADDDEPFPALSAGSNREGAECGERSSNSARRLQNRKEEARSMERREAFSVPRWALASF